MSEKGEFFYNERGHMVIRYRGLEGSAKKWANELSPRLGLPRLTPASIKERLEKGGMSVEEALTTPPRPVGSRSRHHPWRRYNNVPR